MRPVLYKRDFVRRYIAGEFGNHSPSWSTLDDCLKGEVHPHQRRFHIRKRRPWSTGHWLNLTLHSLIVCWDQAARLHGAENLYISVMAPERYKVFQGEVTRSPGGLYLHYNTHALPMRLGMAKGAYSVSGLRAQLLLEHYLCDNSLQWLYYLLDAYDEHVIEFSAYSVNWGTVAGYNTLFWEVRAY